MDNTPEVNTDLVHRRRLCSATYLFRIKPSILRPGDTRSSPGGETRIVGCDGVLVRVLLNLGRLREEDKDVEDLTGVEEIHSGYVPAWMCPMCGSLTYETAGRARALGIKREIDNLPPDESNLGSRGN